MDISIFDNATAKIVIQQTCWFVLKTFGKCTCDCAGIKNLLTQECVDYCLNTTIQHFWGDVIAVFCKNGCYFLRANPLCTTSAVSVHLQVHL
ncbi:hypothetical protein AB205_0136580 [Aquarana catesbeiana]|uniref:Uncharacterized protein n=1 Tax=Aquarana catesbeiana TaxID=8400 RepID=A0A2G9Q7G2_AQUCT|nr:hypothetical protein AB205_0136580 [Aquarana catesbeiana]